MKQKFILCFCNSFRETDEVFLKQEMEADLEAGEYAEDDKPYQTEGDGEISTYEAGSQDNGKFESFLFQTTLFD